MSVGAESFCSSHAGTRPGINLLAHGVRGVLGETFDSVFFSFLYFSKIIMIILGSIPAWRWETNLWGGGGSRECSDSWTTLVPTPSETHAPTSHQQILNIRMLKQLSEALCKMQVEISQKAICEQEQLIVMEAVAFSVLRGENRSLELPQIRNPSSLLTQGCQPVLCHMAHNAK